MTTALAAVLTLLLPRVAQAHNVNKTAMAGSYSVNLKVLPAESFGGPHGAMVRDAGAKPEMLHGPARPNHHMVVFVRRHGHSVEKADVTISYRNLWHQHNHWMELPVVRMHVAGKGLGTTHYGNNVRLGPGKYEVRVSVNGHGPATFYFILKP